MLMGSSGLPGNLRERSYRIRYVVFGWNWVGEMAGKGESQVIDVGLR